MKEYQGRNSYQRNAYVQGSAVRKTEVVPNYIERQEISREQERIAEEKRKRQLHRKRAVARRNREHAMSMSGGYVTFLSIAVIVTCLTAGFYIKLQSDITTRLNHIAVLESEVGNLRLSNDAAYKRIETGMNLSDIKTKAVAMGMSYPAEDQIVYYTMDQSDFMTQYEQIPE